MKNYTVYLCIGASFDSRTEAYNLIEKFHQFLEKNVPIENFEYQDVKTGYRSDYENN